MSSTSEGIVYLVGAGPGDPGLLTVRGLTLLRQADVVVYDRLIGSELLANAPHAELIDVGKEAERHPVSQDRINAILVEQAAAGKVVVRLKGGDPFVFGRGGEEAQVLAAAGITFEIVPGVSSAVAAPAYAGIPVTHRGAAGSFAVIAGHRSEAERNIGSGWISAAGADTLVLLMGVANLPHIVEQLLAAGRSPDTPVAVIRRGTFADQEVVTGALTDISERVAAAGIRPPAVIVVGEVVRLREALRWFDLPERRPLAGLRVLNTRLWPEAAALSARLASLGSVVVELPCAEMKPPADLATLDAALRRIACAGDRLTGFDWLVLTSATAVRCTLDRFFALGYDARALGVRLASLGKATAEELRKYGLRPDFSPSRFSGADLAAEMPEISGQRVLLPRSDLAEGESISRGATEASPSQVASGGGGDGRDIAADLRRHGAIVETVIAYIVHPAEPEPASLQALFGGNLHAALFASPSALHGLAHILGERRLADVLAPACVVCLGPATADAARDQGVRVDLVPMEHTIDGMVEELVRWRKGGVV